MFLGHVCFPTAVGAGTACYLPTLLSFSPAELFTKMESSKKVDSPCAMQANPPLKHHPDRGPGTAVFVPEQGGYKEKFVKPVEDKYKCEKCRQVLCNPKQTECGHRFCESCMANVLRWVPCGRGQLPHSLPWPAPPATYTLVC